MIGSIDISTLLSKLTDLEKRRLPQAQLYALNSSAREVREEWQRVMQTIFESPTQLTLNAPLYRKATLDKLEAEVYIRDEASKGTAPSRYLAPEVFGGPRARKASEKLLGRYWVPGPGAKLDANGNIPGKVITAILSDVGLHRDATANSTRLSRAKRARRRRRRGGVYFVLTKRRGRLSAGVYERIATGFGSAVKSILIFVPGPPHYTKRYDVFGLAQDIFNRGFERNFRAQLLRLVRL